MKNYMRTLMWMTLFGALTSSAWAGTINPCPTTGTYQDLIDTNAAGGCSIVDKVFSGFTLLGTSSGAPAPPTLTAANVSYVLDMSPAPPDFLIGFEFGLSLTAGGTSGNPVVSNDLNIAYNVVQVAGLPEITSLHLLETAFASGGGQATVAETYCLGGLNNTGCTSSGTLTSSADAPKADIVFAGVSQLSIIKDIGVASNQSGGFAAISGIRNAVDESGASNKSPTIPEPSTLSYLLTGVGALGLGWFRIGRRSRL